MCGSLGLVAQVQIDILFYISSSEEAVAQNYEGCRLSSHPIVGFVILLLCGPSYPLSKLWAHVLDCTDTIKKVLFARTAYLIVSDIIFPGMLSSLSLCPLLLL